MRTFCYFLLSALPAAVLPGTLRAGEETVLVPGDPPLTREMVDDYCAFLAWRSGPAIPRVGGAGRLREIVVNEWKNADGQRRAEIVAELKWWREESRRLAEAGRERPAGPGQAPGPDPERVRQSARHAEAIRMLMPQQWNDARQAEIRALSNIQAKHHETMMQIINNIRPTGRYEYNPSTGRYDRYVP